MTQTRLSLRAEHDLDEILAYAASESVTKAEKIYQTIFAALYRLGEFADLGHARPEITRRPVKFYRAGASWLVYDPATRPLTVVAILHAAHDLPTLFADDEPTDV